MNRRFVLLFLVTASVVLFPFRSPAPLVYVAGEGWTYEPVGGVGKWQRARAKEQLDVAEDAFQRHDYGLALKAARRIIRVWPLSDHAPQAQYLVGRCYEAAHNDDRAFKEYQKVFTKYPRSDTVKDVSQRQYAIATRFLAGTWYRRWGYVPFPPTMDRTAEMFSQIVTNGPYGDVAPQAQLRIGAAREKQSKFPDAVAAYERAADRYHDRPIIAADALYRAGISYQKQASTAEYDQSMAGKAIELFTDFMTLYPEDHRVADAQKAIALLRTEQARGNFQIAEFYEKRKKWSGALVYYNEVLLRDPNSPFAGQARQRIDALKKRMQTASN